MLIGQKSEYLDFLPDFLWVIKLVQMSFYPKGLEYLKNNIFHTISNKTV